MRCQALVIREGRKSSKVGASAVIELPRIWSRDWEELVSGILVFSSLLNCVKNILSIPNISQNFTLKFRKS